MSRFTHAIMVAATPVLIAAVNTIALPALAAPGCMTKQEAHQSLSG